MLQINTGSVNCSILSKYLETCCLTIYLLEDRAQDDLSVVAQMHLCLFSGISGVAKNKLLWHLLIQFMYWFFAAKLQKWLHHFMQVAPNKYISEQVALLLAKNEKLVSTRTLFTINVTFCWFWGCLQMINIIIPNSMKRDARIKILQSSIFASEWIPWVVRMLNPQMRTAKWW